MVLATDHTVPEFPKWTKKSFKYRQNGSGSRQVANVCPNSGKQARE